MGPHRSIQAARTALGQHRFIGGLAAIVLLVADPSWACGVSGPDGASLCAIAEGAGPKWRLTASGSYTSTRILWSDGTKADQERAAAAVQLGYAISPRLLIQSGAGMTFGGNVTLPIGAYSFRPGLLLTGGLSYRIFGGPTSQPGKEATDQNPFVVLSANLSFNGTSTESSGTAGSSERYLAFDLRLATVVGVTLLERFRPFLFGRVFGGPIFWSFGGKSVTGTDLYKYQVGGGASLALGRGFALLVEGSALGERNVSGGLSSSF